MEIMKKDAAKDVAVGSLERGILILQALQEATGPLTLMELCGQLDLKPSSAHRLLASLIALGYVVREPAGKRYLPAPQSLAPLNLQHPITMVRLACRSALEALREETGETSSLVLFVGYERLVLDFVIGQRMLAPYYQAWLRSPLHGSASGKLLLAAMEEAHWPAMLGAEPYPTPTPYTLSNLPALRQEIQAVRADQFAISKDEAYEGVSAFGRSFIVEGKALGCVTLTVESASLSPAREQMLLERLQRCVVSVGAAASALRQLRRWLF